MSRYSFQRDLLQSGGVIDLLWSRLGNGLYIFNYHRIGDERATLFDPNVFSCDASHFKRQLETISAKFRIIGVQELLDITSRGKSIGEPLAMITFDDGYFDNYSHAFQILQEVGVPALFFLPTSFIDSDNVPWWDEVAWMIRQTSVEEIRLPAWNFRLRLAQSDIKEAIRLVLKQFKVMRSISINTKLEQVREACRCQMEAGEGKGLFMGWGHVVEMFEAGMDVGSHTRSHNILSHLDARCQMEELSSSKRLIEEKLGAPVQTLAYPEGGPNSFTDETCRLVEECGYKFAFTFIGGYNKAPAKSRFRLLRIPVKGNAEPLDIKYSAVFARSR